MKIETQRDRRKWQDGMLDPGNLLLLAYISAMVCFLLLGGFAEAATDGGVDTQLTRFEEVQRGELLMKMDGGSVLPAAELSQRVTMAISGITSRVVVEQRFQNTSADWVEAVYVFPLPDESSVDHLRLRIGERVLEGEIREKEEALRIHRTAARQGRKSSLLQQNRANIFTTMVTNIGPGEEVTVEIEFQQQIRYRDGVFSTRFPMVVGPRYIPGRALGTDGERLVTVNSTGWAADTDRVPDASQITPPVDVAGQSAIEVEMTIDLASGFPLSRIESLYHKIRTETAGEGHYRLSLTGPGRADRDFVLEWQAQDPATVSAALFAESGDHDQHMLLMLMPPQSLTENPVAREVVFVLDISGSMAGTSIDQAKGALIMALQQLQPSDSFNLIIFNNNAKALFEQVQPADETHLQTALTSIDSLKANGGTEMKPALLLALDGSHKHDRLRQVIFLTDGAVGNEDELFRVIDKRLGDARLFTVGIGSAPNSYFMSRAAEIGRGSFTYIGRQTEVKEKMLTLFSKIAYPVITDLNLNLSGDAEELEIYPAPLPDLYAGEPLVLAIRTGWENAKLRISGFHLGKPWETVVDTSTYGQRDGIASLWARKKIRSQMTALALGADREKVREVVLKTALQYHLVSKFTSLVAVDNRVSRPDGKGLSQLPVKTHLPEGWQAGAIFGGTAKTASPAGLRLLLGCLLLMAAAVMAMMRRGRCVAAD